MNLQLLILGDPAIHRVRSRLLLLTPPLHTHLVAPARSPLLRLFIVHHALLLVLLDALTPREGFPLRLLLLRNGLLAGNLGHGSGKRRLFRHSFPFKRVQQDPHPCSLWGVQTNGSSKTGCCLA